MHYDYTAIPEADVPQAVDPAFQHVVQTYASETNKTVSMWRAVPDNFLDFKPHEKTNYVPRKAAHTWGRRTGTAQTTWPPCNLSPPSRFYPHEIRQTPPTNVTAKGPSAGSWVDDHSS